MNDDFGTVTILAPMAIDTPGRGIHSTHNHIPMCARFSLPEIDSINVAAKKLGVTRAHFIRWCASHVARKVNERGGEGDGIHECSTGT